MKIYKQKNLSLSIYMNILYINKNIYNQYKYIDYINE